MECTIAAIGVGVIGAACGFSFAIFVVVVFGMLERRYIGWRGRAPEGN